MSISLSTLTNPATSDSVLLEAQSEADFLEPIVLFKNRATGSNAISNDATQTTANDQPLSLPLIDGEGYLYVPDVVSNTCSTPDDSSLDITGDITIDIDLTLKNWNDGTERNLVSKYLTSSGQRSYRLFFTTANQLSFVISSSGAFESGGSKTSTATISFPDNQRAQIRVQWRSSDGRVQFFTSTNKGQTFTQLGSDLYTSGITSIYNGSADLDIAHRTNLNRIANSGIHSVQIYDSVTPSSSSLRFNCDFTDTSISDGASSFDCSTGQTITINTGSGVDQARIVRRPKAVFNASEMDLVWDGPTGDYFFVSSLETGVHSGVLSLVNNASYEFAAFGVPRVSHNWDGSQTLLAIFPDTISDSQKASLVTYAKTKSASPDWATSQNLYTQYMNCKLLKRLDLSHFYSLNKTNLGYFFYSCPKLEEIDLTNWDTSNATHFNQFAKNCIALTNVTVGPNCFSQGNCLSFAGAFTNTNLNQQSIDDILVALESAGTSNGTFGRTGGEYPSTTGVAAKNALQARGWSMTFSSEVLPSVLDLEPAAAYSLRALKSSEDPNVVRVRRSSDGALSNFKASEVTDGTLTDWVNNVVTLSPTLNNGGFEDGATGYILGSNASIDTTVSRSGNNSAKLNVVGGGYTYLGKQNSPIEVGQQVKVSFWVKSSIADGSNRFRLVLGSTNNQFTPSSTDWEFYEVTQIIYSTTEMTFARVGTGDFTIHIDDITVTNLTADGHVSTWYDQGGSNDASQTLVSNMPLLVDAGTLVTEGGKPAVDFDGVNSFVNLQHSDLYGQSVLDSYYVTSTNDNPYLYPATGTTPYGMVAASGDSNTTISHGYGSPDFYANGSQITGTTRGDIYTATSGGQKLVAHLGAATSSSGWSNMIFGLYISTSHFAYEGKLQEMIFFNTDQSANRTAIETNINNHFDIY